MLIMAKLKYLCRFSSLVDLLSRGRVLQRKPTVESVILPRLLRGSYQ